MSELRDSFPSLKGRFESGRFDAQEVADFLHSPAVTSGSGNAAKFILSVWSGPRPVTWSEADTPGEEAVAEIDDWRWSWKVLPFDMHYALQIWDDQHRRAFLDWAKDPWWP